MLHLQPLYRQNGYSPISWGHSIQSHAQDAHTFTRRQVGRQSTVAEVNLSVQAHQQPYLFANSYSCDQLLFTCDA
jgi:hypothetical protein